MYIYIFLKRIYSKWIFQFRFCWYFERVIRMLKICCFILCICLSITKFLNFLALACAPHKLAMTKETCGPPQYPDWLADICSCKQRPTT